MAPPSSGLANHRSHMAVSPKIPLPPVTLMSLSMASIGFPTPGVAPAKLDFVANPNHCRIKSADKGAVKTAGPPEGQRVDMSPQVELRLEVQCQAVDEQDVEVERWLSPMR